MRKFGLLAAIVGMLGWALPAVAQSGAYLANGLSTTVKTARTCPASAVVPCGMVWLSCLNPNASAAYVQVFDTTGTVTLGTAVPKLSFGLGATQATVFAVDVKFVAAVKIAATTTATGNTAPGTALDCNVGIQ